MKIEQHKQFAVLFALWMIHAAAALIEFLSLPAEGWSAQRILMSAILFSCLAFFAFAGFSAWLNWAWTRRLFSFAETKRDLMFLSALVLLSVRLAVFFLVMLLQAGGAFPYGAYVARLNPLMDLFALISFEAILIHLFPLFLIRRGGKKELLFKLTIVLGVFGLASLLVYLTGWGVVPGYKGDWSRGIPAVALLEWQILLASLLMLATLLFETKFPPAKRLDAYISLAVWSLAALLWLSQPVIPSSAALPPRAPNFEIYPFNDAQIYDGYAQSVMIGFGYGENIIPQRPLYIVMLVFMHVIAGQNYESVIVLQTLLLAFFPVLLYLFGKEFLGRPIGVSIALLAMLRDVTSNIAAPFTGNLSYSKLYLSEIPTAMTLILFLLVGFRWVKKGFPFFEGFLMGGMLGVGILIRTQAAVALPVLIFLALLSRPREFFQMAKSAALAVLVIALMVAPWFARNWRMTGQLLFDNPASQTANLALRYTRVTGEMADITQLPGESNADYNARMMQIGRQAFSAAPQKVGREIFSAFLNHNINNVLLFPLRYDLESAGELLKPTRAFWQHWRGELNLPQSLLLAFYVFLYGLGIALAWQRLGWLGLLPLGVNLAYNLWTSIALLSGQRFMLAMDWSAYMYYMIGLLALLSLVLCALNKTKQQVSDWYAQNEFSFAAIHTPANRQTYLSLTLLFFGIGYSLWGVEQVFPRRYPRMDVEAALRSSGVDAACFNRAVAEKDLNLLQGRALYPRFYWAGEGETFTDAFGYKKSDENRVVFEMVGGFNNRVVLPVEDEILFFPHASDVTVAMDNENKTWFVIVQKENETRVYRARDFICP